MTNQRITVLMVNEYPDYIDAHVLADGLKTGAGVEFRLRPDAGSKYDIDIVLIDKGAKPGFFDATAPSCAPSSTWVRVSTASISTAFREMSR